MSWENNGVVAVTNASETVTGISTLFADRCRVGDAFRGPDGSFYEITNIVSNTVMSISPVYAGPSKTGQAYTVVPVRGYSKKAADQLHAVLRKIDLMQGEIDLPAWITDGVPVPFSQGGTGATSAEEARTALGVDQVIIDAEESADRSEAAAVVSENSSIVASESKTIAGEKADIATAKAAEARASAESAAAVVTGGTASLTPEAGKIPVGDGEGKIDENWLKLVQVKGKDKTAFMSQDAVTREFEYLGRVAAGYVPFTGPYGLKYNEAEDTYERTGSVNFTAIQSMFRRCLVLPDGTVDYFLNPTNSNYKADGSLANITGADGYLGNVMTQIPKYYRRITDVEGEVTREVSLLPEEGFSLHPAFVEGGVEVPFRYYRAYQGVEIDGKLRSVSGAVPTRSKNITQFRLLAEANGDGWHQVDWFLLDAIRELSSIEIGTFRSQDVLGQGNSTGANYALASGTSNDIGNGSSTSATSGWMSYRGIENFYASIFEFIDGINIREFEPFVNGDFRTFASNIFDGDYISAGVTQPDASGYISEMYHTDKGFFVKTVTGGSTTFFADFYLQGTGNRVWLHGGHASHATYCGSFASDARHSSTGTHASLGAGLAF